MHFFSVFVWSWKADVHLQSWSYFGTLQRFSTDPINHK